MPNKKGYRDLVMSTEGISLNIVENATSDKISKERFKESLGKTQEEVESQNQRGQSRSLYQVLELQARKHKAETNGLVGIPRKEMKRIGKCWA